VYGAIAARDDIDAVVHLGDYIYEYANAQYGDGAALKRLPEPRDRECVTLADYRQRHACYKRDGQLQAVHARHPFIIVWDDHELANDAWIDGAQNHQPEEGSWRSRRDAAVQAWHEWMPVRDGVDPLQIHRSFRFGDLLELAMLDTRLVGREQQQARTALDALANPSRQLLGVAQEQWLRDRLTQSSADGVAWRALGQQIMMAQLRDREGQVYNTDMWDGYPSARTRLYDVLEAASIRDTIVLTGDIHSSWASELRRDPFGPTPSPALAVELTTPAVSSPPPEQPPDLARLLEVHPHVRWVDMQHRGYIAVRFEPQQVRAVWHHTADVTSVHTDVPARKAFVIPRGEAALVDDGSSGD
jgi:alkaline phosphatase D